MNSLQELVQQNLHVHSPVVFIVTNEDLDVKIQQSTNPCINVSFLLPRIISTTPRWILIICVISKAWKAFQTYVKLLIATYLAFSLQLLFIFRFLKCTQD